MNELGSWHYILIWEKKYIKMYYYQHPSMLKLIQLLISSNIKALIAVGIYYIKANEERKNRLNNVIV